MKRSIKNFLIVALALISILGLTACDKKKDLYDDITKECKLSKVYTGKDFLTDGIGEATLVKPTDGDTATFRLSSGTVVIIRFHGIDTPESTGSVEKWGKSASTFCANILKGAESIVLEATAKPAEVDSYGVRYLGYIWYRNSAEEDWKNLNLQIVENGYSENKCFQDAKYPYHSYFAKAESFAKKQKLHIWGDEEDPYYSTEALEVTIRELRENTEIYYNEEEKSGAKVRIEAIIVDLDVSDSGTYLYRAMQYDADGFYYMNIYAGYISSGIPSYIRIGSSYRITGTIQDRDGALQISGLTYVHMTSGGDYLSVINQNYYLTFDSGVEYKNDYGNSLYSDATIKSATLEGTTLTIVATAALKGNQPAMELSTFTFKVPVEAGFNIDDLNNKLLGETPVKFEAKGIVENKVVTVLRSSDFKLK